MGVRKGWGLEAGKDVTLEVGSVNIRHVTLVTLVIEVHLENRVGRKVMRFWELRIRS